MEETVRDLFLQGFEYTILIPSHREAWRYSGPFSRAARFKGSFPGFGIGLGAFAIYWAVDTFVLPKEDHHGEEHH